MCQSSLRPVKVVLLVGFDKIGPFFWHFMLLALPFFWPNYANFYALLAEKCSLMLEILNSNSVKHDLTINLITMAGYVPGTAAKIAGTLSYECIPTRVVPNELSVHCHAHVLLLLDGNLTTLLKF